VNVMNELFATTADVFRLLGDLDPVHDQQPTADGGDRDAVATCRRLARMVGCDAADAPPAAWHALASHWRDRMTDTLAANLAQVLAHAGLPADAPLVAAGCGAFVVPALARRTGRRAVDIATLLPVEPSCAGWARVAAPSVAVALLFAEDGVTCGS
jgi:uncharacterized hydantoinase/oxoprolinase family protein